jgi:hypothetical protein
MATRARTGGAGNGSYQEVEEAIQAGMDRLAKRRSFPVFG